MEPRFLEPNQVIPEILNACQNNHACIKSLQAIFPWIDSENQDYIKLIQLFHQIVVNDYPEDTLIISLGESPSKMVEIQTKMKSWNTKQCKAFFLPVSKTVLHLGLLGLKKFYKKMETFDGDWVDFFEPFIQDNLDADHIYYYMDFLTQRGIMQEFITALQHTRKIIFVDFLMYGNSFVGFFLFLFVPLIYKLELSMQNYTCEAVFLIDPANTHHQIAEALDFLLESYFVRRRLYFLEDILSIENVQPLTDFFMDNPIRTIQQVKAVDYFYPDHLPSKKEYIPILLLVYMMIIMNPELSKLFVFWD
jgi:hypothetical protein